MHPARSHTHRRAQGEGAGPTPVCRCPCRQKRVGGRSASHSPCTASWTRHPPLPDCPHRWSRAECLTTPQPSLQAQSITEFVFFFYSFFFKVKRRRRNGLYYRPTQTQVQCMIKYYDLMTNSCYVVHTLARGKEQQVRENKVTHGEDKFILSKIFLL